MMQLVNSFTEVDQRLTPACEPAGPVLAETCWFKWEGTLRHDELRAWLEGSHYNSCPVETTAQLLARAPDVHQIYVKPHNF